jgi:predicted AAA+ superfamily ATPase
VNEKVKSKIQYYLFIDEVQELKDFKNAIITLYENKNIKLDIYLTGSNSKLLSNELGTFFTGRVHNIMLYPITYKDMRENFKWDLKKYLSYGGMGKILEFLDDEKKIKNELKAILNNSIAKDLLNRHHLKDDNQMQKIITYAFDAIGKLFSINNISAYFRNNKESKISPITVRKYMN